MEYVVGVSALVALVWVVRRWWRGWAERRRVARIRARIDEWLTAEWVDEQSEPRQEQARRCEPRYRRGA